MRFSTSTLAALGAALCLAAPASAQSLTGNVGSAGVTKGEQSIEARLGLRDEGRAGSRIHVDRAFTEWYLLRLIGAFSRSDMGDWSYRGLTVESWFQWREEGDDNSGFNGGARVAYGFADSGADEVGVRFTLTDRFSEGWEWRTNVIGGVETGSERDSGVALQSRFQLSRAVGDGVRLGVELFSEYGTTEDFLGFDEQAHQLGPVVKASFGEGWFLQSAVRFGATSGADDVMGKLFLGVEF